MKKIKFSLLLTITTMLLIAGFTAKSAILPPGETGISFVNSDTCMIDASQAEFQTGALTNVELTSSPGDVKLTNSTPEAADQTSSPAALSVSNNLTGTTWTGQTFRAGVTGNLTKLTVGLGLSSGTSGTITVEIRNLNGANPGTTVLATGTLGPVTNVGTAALYTTTFATPAAVVSGTSYSIVLRLSVGNTVFGVRGYTAGGSSLANGQVFTTTNSGTTWTAINADLYFTSYVTPPVTYFGSGNLVSAVKDANPAVGFAPVWTTLTWTATTPASTAIQLQVAASNSSSGPFNFVGPDGTASTFFTSGASLSRFNGLRYLKYKAFLTSGVTTSTPVLNDVTACLDYVTILSATITSSSNVSCNGGSNGSATVSAAGGSAGYTYSWSPTGGTSATATNLPADTYTVTVTDANLFTTTATIVITEPSFTPGSSYYSLPTSNQTVIKNVSNTNYVTGSCQLLNTVMASGASPVSGSVTNKVWIEGTVPTQNGLPFVQRHYEITPASNASTATGTITLYFTQTDFDNFNTVAASSLKLPAAPSDSVGKANLRIGKYSGSSADATGLPSSYSNGTTVINPDDNDIVWNAVSNCWEVTFTVAGFSGFIVQTNLFTLPITWVSFTVKRQDKSAILNWSTASEQNSKDFIVQYSIDGVSWTSVAILSAAGNSSTLRKYTYVHNNTWKGYNYYRVIQTDLDGKISYSEVKVINLSEDYAAFTIPGNRISNGVLQVQVHKTTTISFYEVSGKLLWIKQLTPGLKSIDVSSYAKGVYLLNADGKAKRILIQ
ncbi:MAG: SprB repeat-containing protein [Niastella sp.]|uniref:SprB repeat-containing protein n=1 Tax=Niastella sp. TaxID=1869183 RepID=UPI00389991D4